MSLVILSVLLAIAVAGLIARARWRRRARASPSGLGPAGSAPSGLRALLAVIVLVAGGEALIAAAPEPALPAHPVERAHRLLEAGLRSAAVAALEGWAFTHLDSVAAQYEYIGVVLDDRGTRRRYRRGEDRGLLNFYEELRASSQGPRRDVAAYALGLCWSKIGDYERAVVNFDSVADRDLPYLSNSEGYARLQLGRTAEAESLFWREVRLGSNVRGAVHNLAQLALRGRDWRALTGLLAERTTRADVPEGARRALLLHEGRLPEYARALFATYRAPLDGRYVLVALFCGLVWFLLIRWWDLFEKEPIGVCVLTVIGGAVAANGALVLQDVLALVADFRLTGHAVADYLYFFVLAGLAEETVKLLPVAAVFLFTRQINEPMDWLEYACLSALGFSVWENYHYLSSYGIHAGLGRVFLCTPFHLSLSGTLAMSIPDALQLRRNPLASLLVALPIVAAVHGAYDFLLGWENGEFAILSYFLALFWGAAFIRGVGWLGSLSPFRTRLEVAHLSVWPWFLSAYLTLCFLIFAINASDLPHAAATELFANNLTVSLGVLFGLCWVYTRLKIGRGPVATAVPGASDPWRGPPAA